MKPVNPNVASVAELSAQIGVTAQKRKRGGSNIEMSMCFRSSTKTAKVKEQELNLKLTGLAPI
ncbi:MAG: hypothetical protein CSA60_01720 [Neptuniibacter caesariensis]|uniref:Uncharacterized protein n=1 Tax=Neptuniibacter caesariensis TaxID=207954 RepID=A0A2G6JR81_NEPCE|nr:MAG: hypothetical protein CSA60_01720 [Neptuniibacter caesariensis]